MSHKGQDDFVGNEKVNIKIIKDKCISAATCVVLAPDTFDLDEDGIAYVKEGSWDDAEQIIKAAESCPTLAVVVEDLEGNQIWPKE
jgi:ferredoxin